MTVYSEISEIAKTIERANKLIDEFVKNHGEVCEGLDWSTAKFVELDEEDIEMFRRHGGESEDCYVDQTQGYLEDDFYGHVYFKTDKPNKFVDVIFAC